MHTIGFLQFGAMADVLYATPTLRHINYTYPDSHITWCIRDKFAEVVETNPYLDSVRTYVLPNGYSSRQEAEHVMWQQMKEDAKKDFDLVIKPQQWPDHNFWRSNKDLVSLMAENAGIDPVIIKDRRIVCETTLEDDRSVNDFILNNSLDGKVVTVNHISYASSNIWSFENYQKLVNLLNKQNIRCVFVGALNEPIPENVYDARGMPYRQWMRMIARSDCYIGLDSGAKTLAAATNTPMIILHSKDFPLQKTGCIAMGIRTQDILELCPAPNPKTIVELIVENMR